jgi:hypothetical protein
VTRTEIVARGFESKDVEYQQAESQRRALSGPALTPAERDRASRRATLVLSLARMRGDLSATSSAAHRAMLERAIADLETELATLE